MHTTRIFVLRARSAKSADANQEAPQLEVEGALDAALREFSPDELPRGRVEVCVLDLNPSDPPPAKERPPSERYRPAKCVTPR
eukprot:9479437-Pyramimonas_sp.AAC.1